jgi:transcriptional regulator with XRE-family HTH domain
MDRHPQPIGKKIKRARERLRWTQVQLGSAVGVSQKTIDNWEHDKTYPKSSIGALEDVLGISLDGTSEPGGLSPTDEWEAAVLSDPDLPDDVKQALILDSRAARAAYSRRAGSRETPRAAPRTEAGL